MLYVGLTEVEHGLLHEMASHRGECAVRSYDQVRLFVHSFVGVRSVNEERFQFNPNVLHDSQSS